MLHWALLSIALVAGLWGGSGVAGTATSIAYVLFVILVSVGFAVFSFIMGKRPPA